MSKSSDASDTKIWFISGVSLDKPPWPSNLIMSKAVLLNPIHTRHIDGEHDGKSRGNEFEHRKRRIYVNLVVLFRILITAQHLSFDHENFWQFVRLSWGCNTSAQQTEQLVRTYVGRRLAYVRSPKIRHKHCDLLTDLIDAWTERAEDVPVSGLPPDHVIAAEWEAVREDWDHQITVNYQSLMRRDNIPPLGTFSWDGETSATLMIKGDASRSGRSSSNSNRELFPARLIKKAEEDELDSKDAVKKFINTPDTIHAGPTTSVVHETAVDELVNTPGQPGQKRRREPNDCDRNITKRQCVQDEPHSLQLGEPAFGVDQTTESNLHLEPEAEKPSSAARDSSSSPLNQNSLSSAPESGRELLQSDKADSRQTGESPEKASMSLGKNIIPYLERDCDILDATFTQPDPTSKEQEASSMVKDGEQNAQETTQTHESQSGNPERRGVEHYQEAQTLDDLVKSVLQPSNLSRDKQKAYNDLTKFTASECQKTLEKLNGITGELTALSNQIAECRQTAHKLQQQQEKQEHGYENQFETVSGNVKSAMQLLDVVQKQQLNRDRKYETCRNAINHQLTNLGSDLKSASQSIQETKNDCQQSVQVVYERLDTTTNRLNSVNSVMASLETRQKNYEENNQKMETRLSNLENLLNGQAVTNTDLEQRLNKIEDALLSNTVLVGNCRTLVEVSKASFDQHFGSLDSRIKYLEQRLSHRIAEQDQASRQQATKMERLEAELKFQKDAISILQRQITSSNRPTERVSLLNQNSNQNMNHRTLA